MPPIESLRRIDAVAVAHRLIRTHLAVRPGEEVLLVADPVTEAEMVWALAGAVQAAGAEYTVAVMPTRERARANDLTRVIERALEGADVLIGLTASCGAPTYALTVTRLLQQKRLRSLSMVMRSMENWTRGAATADYEALDRLGRKVAELWAGAEEVHITSPAGTDFRARVTKEPVMDQVVIVECGIAREPGREAAFSDGEVSQRPREATAEGVLVVDGPIASLGSGDPVALEVRAGRVVAVRPHLGGGAGRDGAPRPQGPGAGPDGAASRARQLERIFETVPGSDHIAEIGLGLNPAALRNGDFEEEKKAEGNVHVAIGDDLFYGGCNRCAVHLDLVIRGVTFRLDGVPLVENGRLDLGGSFGRQAKPA